MEISIVWAVAPLEIADQLGTSSAVNIRTKYVVLARRPVNVSACCVSGLTPDVDLSTRMRVPVADAVAVRLSISVETLE